MWNRHGEIDEVIDEHHFMDSVSSSNPMNDYHTTITDVVDHFFNENYEYEENANLIIQRFYDMFNAANNCCGMGVKIIHNYQQR